MKITAVRPFPIWVGDRDQLLVKVETDEGISGWGESGLSSRELAVRRRRHYEQFLIGRDPMLAGRLWQEMLQKPVLRGRVLLAAKSLPSILHCTT